jgi:hypothetical protein
MAPEASLRHAQWCRSGTKGTIPIWELGEVGTALGFRCMLSRCWEFPRHDLALTCGLSCPERWGRFFGHPKRPSTEAAFKAVRTVVIEVVFTPRHRYTPVLSLSATDTVLSAPSGPASEPADQCHQPARSGAWIKQGHPPRRQQIKPQLDLLGRAASPTKGGDIMSDAG